MLTFSSLAVWLLSFAVECLLERWLQKWLFRAVFGKDIVFALTNIGIIGITQWGILSRCSCWTTWGTTGLHLPQIPSVKAELMNYIRNIAPWILVAAIVFQFVFCVMVAWKYWDAVRVFIQRDDGVSNTQWRDPKSKGHRKT
jgi:hypothetical protein